LGEAIVCRQLSQVRCRAHSRRIVVDTCNYYPERDGLVPGLEGTAETTSGLLQKTLPNVVVVKAFNSVLASHLARGGAVLPDGGRHALPYAADDLAMCGLVAQLVKDAGFDAVFAGPIKESWRFERPPRLLSCARCA
jgi:8-hydroxy-5-deazaflavin:NADPH oxidoreductase